MKNILALIFFFCTPLALAYDNIPQCDLATASDKQCFGKDDYGRERIFSNSKYNETETPSRLPDVAQPELNEDGCPADEPNYAKINGQDACLTRHSVTTYNACINNGYGSLIKFYPGAGDRAISCESPNEVESSSKLEDDGTTAETKAKNASSTSPDNQDYKINTGQSTKPNNYTVERVCVGSSDANSPNPNLVDIDYKCKRAALKADQDCNAGDFGCYSEVLEICDGSSSCKKKLLQDQFHGPNIKDKLAAIRAALSSEVRTKAENQEILKACTEQKNKANECCSNPMSCFFEGNNAGAALGIGMNLMQGISMSQVNDPQQGIQKLCEMRKTASTVSGGLNSAAAFMCGTKKGNCEQICEEIESQMLSKIDIAENICESDSNKPFITLLDDTTKKMCKTSVLETVKTQAYGYKTSCDALSDKQFALGAQAALSFGNMVMSKCGDVTTNSTSFPDEGDGSVAFNGDCTNPAFMDNPTCVACRQDPSQSICAGLVGFEKGLGGPDGNANDDYAVQATDFGNTLGLDGMDGDNPGSDDPFGGPGGGNSGLTDSKGGGGSGPGGGGSGIQAFGSGKGRGGKGGRGLNTDILKGARGGGGYSSKVGFQSGGGFAGYVNKGKKNAKKAFNLKDYLPGGKKYKKRGLAGVGMARKNPEIHSPHRNIFLIHSQRFKVVCKKYLYDCK